MHQNTVINLRRLHTPLHQTLSVGSSANFANPSDQCGLYNLKTFDVDVSSGCMFSCAFCNLLSVGVSTTQILYEIVCLNVLNWRKMLQFLYILYWWFCLFLTAFKKYVHHCFIFVTNTTEDKCYLETFFFNHQFPEMCFYGLTQ